MARILTALVLVLLWSAPALAEKRVALVVGNSAYLHTTKLDNPQNDAADMAAALRKVDFEVVEGFDLDKAAFDRKVKEFSAALRGADVGVFFYAGHGLQVAGQNYLVPVDAKLEDNDSLEWEMLRLELVHRIMERAANTNIIFLDACRNNPLARNLARAMGTRSADIGKGLAAVESGVGTLISFSTQPGNVALDGQGRNSPFAGALVRRITASGDDLSALLIDVRNDVRKETQNKQIPWEHSALTGRFYFNPQAPKAQPTLAAPQPGDAERAWRWVKDTNNAALIASFIKEFGNTEFGAQARARLEELRKTQPSQPVAKASPPKSLSPDGVKALNLFRDVVGRIRTDYVEPPDEQFLIGMAVDGMLKKFPSGTGAEKAKLAAIIPARQGESGGQPRERSLTTFGTVLQHVLDEHEGEPEAGADAVITVALNEMMTALDPHSAFLDAKRFRDMQVQTRGEFGGLGLEVTMENSAVKVVSPIDGAPAARAGMQANDLITHLDGSPVAPLTLEQAVEKMRGPVGAAIVLTVTRQGRQGSFEVRIVRELIRIAAVKTRQEGDVGYIKISTFNEQAHASLTTNVAALKKAMGKAIKGYVIDLRNNPGGLLDQAVQVSDAFLDKGLIVQTKGRANPAGQRASAHPGDITDGKRLVVLINGGTASASEIVAGALQDHKRAIVVGTRSFGKGSVQTIIPLGGNGALRLTTARYFTPSGRSIQAEGINPDVVVEQELPADAQAAGAPPPKNEASLPGHLKNASKNSEPREGSSSYVPQDPAKDTQLQYALKYLRGQH